MANRYWVGNSGNWSDNVNHWASISGGTAGASLPTSVDSVFFDANSFTSISQTVTINVAANCLDMDWTAATNNPSLAGSFTINVFGSLTLISSMIYSSDGDINFKGVSNHTITTANRTIGSGNITFSGIGGTYTLQDNLTTTGTINLNAGALDTNSKNVSAFSFTLQSNSAKALTLRSSTVSLTGDWVYSGSGLTFNANTSLITMNSGGRVFNGGGASYNNASFTATPTTIQGSSTFNTITISAGKILKLTSGTTQTITNLVANGTNSSRVTLQSVTSGSAATISTASVINQTFLIVQDITRTGVGTATFNLSQNKSGNTGITFNNDLYWIAGAGNWSSTAHWSLTSGGVAANATPTSYINAYFDTNSFTSVSKTVTVDISASCLSFDWTGATNTPVWAGTSGLSISGSLTLIASMTVSYNGLITLAATTTGNTITTAGITLSSDIITNFSSGGWTLQDNLTTTSNITHTNGLLNTNNKNIAVDTFNLTGSGIRTFTLGSSIISIINDWNATSVSNVTFNAGTSEIQLKGSSRSFFGGGLTYNKVTFFQSYPIKDSNNTIALLTINSGKTLTVLSGSTQNIASISADGTASQITIASITAGIPFTLSSPTGTINVVHCNIQDSTVTGGATFNAYYSVNVSGNTGWNFPAGNPPFTGYQHKVMGQLIVKINGVISLKVNKV